MWVCGSFSSHARTLFQLARWRPILLERCWPVLSWRKWEKTRHWWALAAAIFSFLHILSWYLHGVIWCRKYAEPTLPADAEKWHCTDVHRVDRAHSWDQRLGDKDWILQPFHLSSHGPEDLDIFYLCWWLLMYVDVLFWSFFPPNLTNEKADSLRNKHPNTSNAFCHFQNFGSSDSWTGVPKLRVGPFSSSLTVAAATSGSRCCVMDLTWPWDWWDRLDDIPGKGATRQRRESRQRPIWRRCDFFPKLLWYKQRVATVKRTD